MSDLIRREDLENWLRTECYGTDTDDDKEYVIGRLRKELPTIASPWHRMEEPPKEEHRTYLVYTDTGYMCSCRWTNNVYGLGASDRWGWCLADIPQFQEVVYWMPIELPKEDA